MAPDEILTKVRHLLAMAEHPRSNEHEAALALERAQELLLKHNLTRAQVIIDHPETPAGIGMIDRTEYHGFTWKVALVAAIAKYNLCRIVQTPGKKTIHIFGTQENVRSVLAMFDWVAPELERLATYRLMEYKRQGGQEHGKTFKQGFFLGAVDVIKGRLRRPYESFAATTGKELIVLNQVALDAAVKRVYPRLGKGAPLIQRSIYGYNAGKEEGRKVSLTPTKRVGNTLRLPQA